MKRWVAVAFTAALVIGMASSVVQSWAAPVAPNTGVRQMFFRHHLAAVAGKDNWTMAGWKCDNDACYDSSMACGNGTGLVDTTVTFSMKNVAYAPYAALADTAKTGIKVLVTQDAGIAVAGTSVADLNAATITIQGSVDNYTWVTLRAATSTTTPGADPQKVAQADFLFGNVGIALWPNLRFILTGISNTTGCFNLYVAHVKADPEKE